MFPDDSTDRTAGDVEVARIGSERTATSRRDGADTAEDEKLTEAFLEGHMEAIRTVSGWVKSVVLHKVWGFDDAEDIIQAALLALVQNLRSGRFKSGNFQAYTRTIAKNICITSYRRLKTRGVEVPFNDASYSSTRHSSDKSVERRAAISRILDRLNENCRRLLLLAYVQGYTRKEIAESLGIREETVRVRLFRCVRSARILLEGSAEPDEQHS